MTRILKYICVISILSIFLDISAEAQVLDLSGLEDTGPFTGRLIQLILLIGVLSLAPSILIMTTSFTRIVIVLSLLRSAMGLQQSPPNVVLVSLALFLTMFVMAPTFEQAYDEGLAPLIEDRIEEADAIEKIVAPFRAFMARHARDEDVVLFLGMANEDLPESRSDLSLRVLIPAFMISELRRAFEIGFLIFVPFIVIDMVVASVLMSMGMMMLPPVLISLPFKLIFFVLVDGWHLIAGSLVASFFN